MTSELPAQGNAPATPSSASAAASPSGFVDAEPVWLDADATAVKTEALTA